MDLWVILSGVIVTGSFLFVLLCTSPDRDSVSSKLRRLLYLHTLTYMKSLSIGCFGTGLTGKVVYYLTYIIKQKNPCFQVLYLILSLSGYTIYYIEGFRYIPNPYVPVFHKYFGTLFYFMSFCTFIVACRAKSDKITSMNVKDHQAVFPYDNLLYKELECRTCELLKPARSKHCSTCNACIAKHDHHCVWLNQCVGYSNYKYFLAFIMSHSVVCLYAGELGLLSFYYLFQRDKGIHRKFYDSQGNLTASYYSIFTYMSRRYPSFGFCIVLCLTVGLALSGFFLYHVYLIKKNYTSNERMKILRLTVKKELPVGYSHRYSKGFISNLYEVLEAEPFE